MDVTHGGRPVHLACQSSTWISHEPGSLTYPVPSLCTAQMPSDRARTPRAELPKHHPSLLGADRHLGDILEKAGHNATQAALEPLILGIGGRFADRAGIDKLDHLWGLVQVCVYPAVHACSAVPSVNEYIHPAARADEYESESKCLSS